MKIDIETRKNNLILMKALEEIDQFLVKKFFQSNEIGQMNQTEISMMIQDSMLGTFVDEDKIPLKLNNKTLMCMMSYKLNKINEKQSKNDNI
jgi:hypothetical protein